MSEIDLELANKWSEEARVILQNSNEICSEANKKSNSIIDQINEILASNRYQFLVDSVSQQLRLLDIIRNSMEQLIQSFQVEYSEELNERSLEQLEEVLDQLQQIKTTNNRSLYDFINHEEISSTTSNFVKLRNHLNHGKKAMSVASVSDKLKLFQTELSGLLDKKSIDLITIDLDSIVGENNELEQDMAGLLESLTKHFDQTNKSITFFKDPKILNSSKHELYEVLRNDSLELPGVIHELQGINQTFLSNCDVIIGKLESFEKDEKSLLEFFQNLKNYGNSLQSEFIVNFNKIYNDIIDNFLEFNDMNDNLLELTKYYRSFIRSFERLDEELNRRRKVNEKLKTLITDFKASFQEIESDDRAIRETFLLENGEFLPKNILDEHNSENSNILYNLLPNIEVYFQPENIPKL